jgi:bifunctional non-homologous end joining protein LigD
MPLAAGGTVGDHRRAAPAAPVVAGIPITHPDRVICPSFGVTKLEVVRYYEAVAARMLPHLRGRPLTLKQCTPDVEHCRFLRHSGFRAPPSVRVVQIQEKTKVGDYMVVDSIGGLIALAQWNMIEFHTWNATVDHLECPDRLVFDLDPGPEVPWPAVVRAGKDMHDTLRRLGLRSWVKTTGGRGLHVVVPIEPEHDWSACLAFARTVTASLASRAPDRYTTAFAKRGRESLILLDYLRNNRTNTAVAAYSLRARPGLTVSTPLTWRELSAAPGPGRWTLATFRRRLRSPDPWAGYFHAKQRLPL